FKPRTDDVRDAPALTVARILLEHGATLSAYDPEAMENARRELGDSVRYFDDAYEALRGADALLVMTEWNEFRYPDFDLMLELMRRPIVYDGRNIYDPERMEQLGFEYHCIGRGRA
ncbi:MAG: UDP-glucose/GDP-mannose dehydrogenase family protein, partial [Deltaproteobacteria bacterium]